MVLRPEKLFVAHCIGRSQIVAAIPSSDITADEGSVASIHTMPASEPEGFAEMEVDMPPPQQHSIAPSQPSVTSTNISGLGSVVNRFCMLAAVSRSSTDRRHTA